MLTDDEAKRAAWAIFASAWVGREGFEIFLPPSFLSLDPGDVVEVEKISGALTATLRLCLTGIDPLGCLAAAVGHEIIQFTQCPADRRDPEAALQALA